MKIDLNPRVVAAEPQHFCPKNEKVQLPRIAVTYLLNPYDNPQFGDRVLGSLLPAFFVCQDIQKAFPDCKLIGSNAVDAQDFGKLEIGKELLIGSELICPQKKLPNYYDYTISIEPDPASSLMAALERAQKTKDVSQIDLAKTPPVMRAVLMKNGNVESNVQIQGNQLSSAVESLIRKISPEHSVLVEIPYSTLSEFDEKNFVIAEGRSPLPLSPINLYDPSFQARLKASLTPSKSIPAIPFKEGYVPAVMNVRTGGSSDSSPTVKRYPAKFPPIEWYVLATKELKSKFPNEKVQIHIATDGNPSEVKQELDKRCIDAGIQGVEFTFLKKEDLPKNTNLMEVDLWGAKKIKALIRADSASGTMIGCNADPDALDYILMPKVSPRSEPSRLTLPMAASKNKNEKHIDVFANAKTAEIRGNQFKVDQNHTQIIDLPSLRRYQKLQRALSYFFIKV